MKGHWIPQGEVEWIVFALMTLCIVFLIARLLRIRENNRRVDEYNAWRIESQREIAREMAEIYRDKR